MSTSTKRHSYEFVKKQFEKRGYKLLTENYINAHQKLKYICPKHTEEIMEINFNKLMLGRGCRKCGNELRGRKVSEKRRIKFSEVANKFNETDLKLLTTQEEFKDGSSYVRFTCPVHPDIIQKKIFWSFKAKPWCPICKTKEGNQKLKNSKISYSKVKEAYEEEGYKLLTPEEKYTNCLTKIAYICPLHGKQTGTYGHFKEGKRCPMCNSSKGEKEIRRILKSYNIKFEEQKKFKDLKGERNHYLSYDFYIPNLNILIEYQGEYHDETMYNLTDYITYEAYAKQKERDNKKRRYAKEHNMNLLEIWYYDFKNIENILKERGII